MMKAKNAYALILCTLSMKSIADSDTRAHIAVDPDVPGIGSLFKFRPDTAAIMMSLGKVLLRDNSIILPSHRQLIASYVSWLNQCKWCCNVHSSIAAHLPGVDASIVQAVKDDFETAPIPEKIKAFLNIASKVQGDARTVSDEDIARARAHGATDLEIHDVVLIAAMYCMNNRYVMGLDALTPEDPAFYEKYGKALADRK
jgi:uncharacterized peroxidase-related enzyme